MAIAWVKRCRWKGRCLTFFRNSALDGEKGTRTNAPVCRSQFRQGFGGLNADRVLAKPNYPNDLILNNIGYHLLFGDETDATVAFFRLNTELFPEVANGWDSYGEGLRRQGKPAEALNAYRKALKIRPDLASARRVVEGLTKE